LIFAVPQADHVIGKFVKPAEVQPVINLQMIKDTPYGLSLIQAPDIMHTCVEEAVSSPESLQAASCVVALLEDADIVALTTQYIAAEQSSQSTTDDDDIVSGHASDLQLKLIISGS
jgi:hypothetical protein